MAVTSASVAYRVRIAAAGASSIGTPDLTLTEVDFDTTPIITGPSVDLLEATTTSHPFTLGVIVDTVLFTSSDRFQVLGRLIDVQRNVDSGGWTTITTGRVSNVSEPDGRGRIMLEVSDERWTERRTQIFRTTTSVQLHPPGLDSAWMDEPAAGTATYVVHAVSGDAVHIKLSSSEVAESSLDFIPLSLREALASDLVRIQNLSATNSAGNFTSLRFRYSSGDRTVISFKPTLGGLTGSTSQDGPLGSLTPGPGGGVLFDAWFYMSAHGLSVNDQITGRFYFPTGIPVTEELPSLIGGAAGVHPMQLLKDIYDGNYGGVAVNYDSTAMTALTSLSLRPVWVRLTAPAERATWLQKNVYKPYAVLPLVGTDFVVRPTALRMPVNVNPATYTTLTASDSNLPEWAHTTRDLVNVVTFQSSFVRPISQVTEPSGAHGIDRLAAVKYGAPDITYATTSTLGEIVHEIDTDLIFQRWQYRFPLDEAEHLADELFHIFGDGPTRYLISVQDTDTTEVGDVVTLDFDTLKAFNPADDDRTGDRLALVIGFREFTPAGKVFECLDLGPDSAILTAPTLTVAQDGTDEHIINVTIADLNAGETATVELEIATSSPSTYSYVRSGVGNETIEFDVSEDIGVASQTAYGRAFTTAPHRIRSAYATDTDALTVGARITSAAVEKVGRSAVVTWTVPSGTLGIRSRYSLHNRDQTPTYGNQTDYDAADGGFTISPVSHRQVASVELVAYPGWSDPNVTGSAGATVEVESHLPKVKGPRLRRDPAPSIELSFDEDGCAVVSASGDEEAENIYVTVGDGSAPSDPTVATNDGTISGFTGSVPTGVAVATGNEVYAKAVAADIDGNLSEVASARASKRIGAFHKDTSTRQTSSTSETTLDTITIPADTLGTNGGFILHGRMAFQGSAGTKTVRIKFGGSTLATTVRAAGDTGALTFQFLLFNDGATNSQDGIGTFWSEHAGAEVDIDASGASIDTTANADITITGQLANGADTIQLVMTYGHYVGTT